MATCIRKRVTHTLLLLLSMALLGCVRDSHGLDAFTNPEESGDQQHSLAVEECAVYSALIDELYVGETSKPLTIFSQTSISNLPHSDLMETLHIVSKGFPGGIPTELLDDFAKRNERPSKLSCLPRTGVEYVFLSKEDLARIFDQGFGWNEYYASYHGQGIIEFSRVGFNPEMKVALAYTSIRSGPKTGIGYYVVLSKECSGWAIKHKVDAWVS